VLFLVISITKYFSNIQPKIRGWRRTKCTIKKEEKKERMLQKKCNVCQGEKVLDFLRGTFPKEYNAPTLEKTLGIPYSNVRVILTRYSKKGKIERTHRGFYRAKMTGDLVHKLGDPPIKSHGILIHGMLQKSIGGIDSVTIEKLLNLGFEEKSNGRLVYHSDWEGRRMTVVVHGGKGFAQVYLKCSDNPVGGAELERFRDFLNGLFRPVCPWVPWQFVRGDMNRDFGGVHIPGGGAVSSRVARNARAQVYEHPGRGVRAEIQGSFVDVTLDEVVALLGRLTERPGGGQPGGVASPGGSVGGDGVPVDDRERGRLVLRFLEREGGGGNEVSLDVFWNGLRWAFRSEFELEEVIGGLKAEGYILEPSFHVYRLP
jgi:hypothetical protein